MAANFAKALNYMKPFVARHVKYAKVELMPPGPGDIAAGLGGIMANAGKLAGGKAVLNMTVKDAVVASLVGAEIACWFFVGEIIGKGGLIGYDTRTAREKYGSHYRDPVLGMIPLMSTE